MILYTVHPDKVGTVHCLLMKGRVFMALDSTALSYEQYRELLKDERKPCAMVNLDALEENSRRMLKSVQGTEKSVRVASKSIRCPWILKHIVGSDPLYRGIMSFTVEEAAFLVDEGYDDILIAYPSAQPSDMKLMADMAARGKRVSLIVDSEAHLDALGAAGRARGVTTGAAIELDVSYRRLGNAVHVGARRSPVRDPERVVQLIRYAEKTGGVTVRGMMGYEAQIAGVTDKNPFAKSLNRVAKLVKALSRPDVARQRANVFRLLEKSSIKLDFINGGGTGSLSSTPQESAVTEVTVGSGFYCSHLFSYFENLDLIPAAFFALQVVRSSDPGYMTCHGGGYVASGAAGPDKAPIPHSPPGLKIITMEGTGEVQTPIILPDNAPNLKPGDPIIWRHAKAGELMERFNEVLLIRGGKLLDKVPTYRGLGKSFL